MRRRIAWAGSPAALAAALALSGCAVGPNYERPPLASPESFRGEAAPPSASSLADLPWWEVFNDPTLVALIQESLQNNYDLRVAVARVEESYAGVGVARSELFPQFGYDFIASRGRGTSFGGQPTGAVTGIGSTSNLFVAALNVSWEIDIWGRIRRATQAAQGQFLATDAARRGVILSLVAGVAQAYFELRELDAELEITRNSVDTFQKTLALFTRQFQGGVASKLEVERTRAALAQAAATVPRLEAQIVAQEDQLCVLLGRPPGPIPRGTSLIDQKVPSPEVPAGLPSALLERRPDLVQAEEIAYSANANVGVSIANFLPTIGLTSLYGSQSTQLSNLLTKGTGIWGIAGQAAGPLFRGGQLYYTYKGARATLEETQALYQGTVLTALQEVSDALAARQKLVESREQQIVAVTALEESVRLSLLRYTDGLANYIEVLDAQQQLFPAETTLAQVERDQLLAVVLLYKALGGGWSLDAMPGTPTTPTPAPAPSP
ncbi:MAG TPA: efflux transporter outer membrane subunit [Myxococcota bacterium]|nr:efflux transporter outer membrane subunit [Myxococcota bacterium]